MSRTVGEQVKTGFRLAGGILSFCASLFLQRREGREVGIMVLSSRR